MVIESMAEFANADKLSILNEPNMILLGSDEVNLWSKGAYSAVRDSGFEGSIVISNGFLPPNDFIGEFSQKTYPG